MFNILIITGIIETIIIVPLVYLYFTTVKYKFRKYPTLQSYIDAYKPYQAEIDQLGEERALELYRRLATWEYTHQDQQAIDSPEWLAIFREYYPDFEF